MTNLDYAVDNFVNNVGNDYLSNIFALFLVGIIFYNIINEFIL
jgi:hypothetical protein